MINGKNTIKHKNKFCFFHDITKKYLCVSEISNIKRSYFIKQDRKFIVKPNLLFILGPPGSGKGTQCTLLADYYNIKHISAGDLLRKEMSKEISEFKNIINHHIYNGSIVPVEITCSLIEQEIKNHYEINKINNEYYYAKENGLLNGSNSNNNTNIKSKNKNSLNFDSKTYFLIDGFPRNSNNFEGFMKQLGNEVNIKCMIVIDLKDDKIFERLNKRNREDDDTGIIQKRIDGYHHNTEAIYSEFNKISELVFINGDNDKKRVFNELKNKVKYLF